MDNDQESLLTSAERQQLVGLSLRANGYTSTSRWRKNLLLLIILFFIAVCLTVYFYLNMQAINGNQLDPSSYKPLSRRKPMLDHESIFSESGPSMIKLSDLLAHCLVALRIAGQEVVNLSLAKKGQLSDVHSKGKTLEGVDDVVTGADMKSHQMILKTIKDSYRRLRIVSEEDSTAGYESLSLEDDILPIDRVKFAQLLRSELHEIEEDHADRGSLIAQHETLVWIDPLDATKEYSENLTQYVTLMACIVHKEKPIAGVIFKPFTNQTYWSLLDESRNEFHHSRDLTKALVYANQQTKSDVLRLIVSRSHAGDVKSILRKGYGSSADVISAGGSGYKSIELVSGRADAYIHTTHIKKWDICAPHAIVSSIPPGRMSDLNDNEILFGNPKDRVVKTGLLATLKKSLHQELINLVKNSELHKN